jgi:hypothetical protein
MEVAYVALKIFLNFSFKCQAGSSAFSPVHFLASYAILTDSRPCETDTLSLIAAYPSGDRTMRDSNSSLLRYGRLSINRCCASADIPSAAN